MVFATLEETRLALHLAHPPSRGVAAIVRRLEGVAVIVAAVLALLVGSAGAQLDLPRKVKERVKNDVERAERKTGESIEKSAGAESAGQNAAGAPAGNGRLSVSVTPLGGTAYSEDMTLTASCAFVPGEKALFIDEFSAAGPGAFPGRWEIVKGDFATETIGDDAVIVCRDEGTLRPRLAPGPLPARYTIEVDLHAGGLRDSMQTYVLKWIDASGAKICEFSFDTAGYRRVWWNGTVFEHGNFRPTHLKPGAKLEMFSNTVGSHHAAYRSIRITAIDGVFDCYLDYQKIAAAGQMDDDFTPAGLEISVSGGRPESPCVIAAFRFAEMGRPLRDQIQADGRAVTRGILFDPGADKIKAGSFKTLSDIARLLGADPALRISIEAHTDGASSVAASVDATSPSPSTDPASLSERRAAAIRTYLIETYSIDGTRLVAKVWGDSKPLAASDTPEGRANNVRVEIVRL